MVMYSNNSFSRLYCNTPLGLLCYIMAESGLKNFYRWQSIIIIRITFLSYRLQSYAKVNNHLDLIFFYLSIFYHLTFIYHIHTKELYNIFWREYCQGVSYTLVICGYFLTIHFASWYGDKLTFFKIRNVIVDFRILLLLEWEGVLVAVTMNTATISNSRFFVLVIISSNLRHVRLITKALFSTYHSQA